MSEKTVTKCRGADSDPFDCGVFALIFIAAALTSVVAQLGRIVDALEALKAPPEVEAKVEEVRGE